MTPIKPLLILIILSIFFIPTINAMRPNYVYDWEELLTDEQEATLNVLCKSIEEKTQTIKETGNLDDGAEVVIITLKTAEGRNQEQVREYYYNDYSLDGVKGIGKTGKNNGVLLIISLTENFWGIEVGYGLEGDLMDSESGRIGREILVKYLKEDDNFKAINLTITAIGRELTKTEVPEPDAPEPSISPELAQSAIMGIAVVGVLMVVGLVGIAFQNRIDNRWRERLDEQRTEYNSKIQKLDNEIVRLTPNPVKTAVCPHCEGERRAEIQSREGREALINGFYWTWIIYGLTCLGCGTKFIEETEKNRGESEEERTQRLLEEEQEEEEHQRSYYHHSSSHGSSSGGFGGGSFGGGHSGGGGAGGGIR